MPEAEDSSKAGADHGPSSHSYSKLAQCSLIGMHIIVESAKSTHSSEDRSDLGFEFKVGLALLQLLTVSAHEI